MTLTPSESNMGQNAWAGWEKDVLGDLGNSKPSNDTIAFLDLWQTYEHSKAHNNPLNITAPPGIGSINSAGVQSYATPSQGALYTANLIKTSYPTLYNMLKNNKVKDTLLGSTSITGGHLSSLDHLVTELNTWGSHNFANYLSGGESTADKTVNTVHSFGDWWNWLTSNWERIAWVLGGAILIILAIVIFGKSAQSNTFTFARGDS